MAKEADLEMFLIDTKDLCAMTGFSRQRISALRKDPSMAFPQPLNIGRSVRWKTNEIKLWLDALAGGAPALAALAADTGIVPTKKTPKRVRRSIFLEPASRPTAAQVEEENRRVLAIPLHPGITRLGKMVKTREGGEVWGHKLVTSKKAPPPVERVELRTLRKPPPRINPGTSSVVDGREGGPTPTAAVGPTIDLAGPPAPEALARLKGEYEGGKSLDALCAQHKIGKSRLSKLLRDAGAAMRSPGRKKVGARTD